MKIESNPPPSSLLAVEKSQPKARSKVAESQTSSKETSTDLGQKINRWFAQAGVQTPHNVGVKRDIEARVSRRERLAKQRKLQNLEAVLEQALDVRMQRESTVPLDPDWFFHFIDLAEHAYSPAMQELWGKIFAVEINRPGSFSLKTLQSLQQLTQKDAQLLRLAASLSCRKQGGHVPKLIVGFYRKPGLLSILPSKRTWELNLAEYGLSYPNLLALMDLGLIYTNEIESAEMPLDKLEHWRHGQKSFAINANKAGTALHYYKYTHVGTELFRLMSGNPNEQYFYDLVNLLSNGFDVQI